MSNFIVIEKDSLSKSTVNSANITLTEASIVHTKMHRDDVAEFIRDGNNLVLKLKNGEVVVIENFFVQYDEVASDLVFEEDNCALYWFDGISGFKGISGLEALLPAVEGSKLIGLLPWIVGGGLVAGGIIAATDDDDKDSSPVVDKTPPQVTVEIDPEGNITIKYPSDVNPDSIDKDKITITDKDGNPIDVDLGEPVKQPDGSYEITGKVPEDVEGDVTVEVPEGSYEDTSGNPGLPGTDNENVNMVPPQVEVIVGEDGTITLKYPNDTDLSSITTNKITVKDPTGKDIVVDFGTPVMQPDGSITVTGKVPEGMDGSITVTVPEGSYKDTSGNSGLIGKGEGDVDTVPPTVEVIINPDHSVTFKFSEKVSNFDPTDILVAGGNLYLEVL